MPSASQKALIASKAPKARDFTSQRVRKDGEIDEAERSKNHNKSRVRARVEHVFAVVNRLWGFANTVYDVLDLRSLEQRKEEAQRPAWQFW